MSAEERVVGATSVAADIAEKPLVIVQKCISGRSVRKTGANTPKFKRKFHSVFWLIAECSDATFRKPACAELTVELLQHQSLFPLSQKRQLRLVSEVLSPALVGDVPFTHPVPALTEHRKWATESRRVRAPLAGRLAGITTRAARPIAPRAR